MIKENSGVIYRFPLDFELGYGFGELIDFTNENWFSGLLFKIFNTFEKDIKNNLGYREIINSGKLYGPIPLDKLPDTKGPNAWEIIGKIEPTITAIPIMKNIRGSYMVDDWSSVGPWHEIHNLSSESDASKPYEELRTLELPIIHSIKDVQTRTTMHILINKKEDVGGYYDLSSMKFRHLYIRILNTSLNKKSASVQLQRLGLLK